MNKNIRYVVITLMLLAWTSISCGMSSLPFLATETPTPTATFTPSPTPTPSSTPTPTQTPTATPLPTGVRTEEQANGSILFIDYDNKYQLVIPEGWFVIPLSSEDIGDILNNMAGENPDFKETAETFKQLDPDVIRVIAVNKSSKYIYKGYSTNITVTAIEDKLASSMPLDFLTGALEESLKQQGARLLSSGNLATTNANGVEIGMFDFQQSTPTYTGANIEARAKTVIFQTNDKLIMIQLAIPQQFAEELLPVLDTVTDSLKLMEP